MGKLRLYPLLLGEAEVSAKLDIFWSLSKDETVVKVPILGFLILGGSHPVLVDTGFRSAERCTSVHKLGPHRTRDEWSVGAQLGRFGITRDDIRYVVLTHLHYDHVGNCESFPNAEIVVQREELKAAAAPKARHIAVGGGGLFYDRMDVAMLVDRLWAQVALIEGAEEIIPGVRCEPFWNSHTPGSQVVYVDTNAGRVACIGDICRKTEINIEQQIPPGLYYDLESMQMAIYKLKRDADICLPTHDYKVWENYGNDGL